MIETPTVLRITSFINSKASVEFFAVYVIDATTIFRCLLLNMYVKLASWKLFHD